MQIARSRILFFRRNASASSRETSNFKILRPLQALHFYGAGGIIAFGWALSHWHQFNADHYLPLWLAGALAIYNLDRLKIDPADAFNTPERLRQYASLRKAGIVITLLSALAILAIPAYLRDWSLFFLALIGGLLVLNYSVPLLGFRFKAVPFIKTVFPPTLLTAAYFAPPILEQQGTLASFLPGIAWTWCVLLFNMILCDRRDIEGDQATGIATLPVLLGPVWTSRLLILLLGLIVALSPSHGWPVALYGAGLLRALQKPRPEAFYEWWVEGILFVPALFLLL